MANQGLASVAHNRQPAPLRARATSSNRNNTSFKIAHNSLIINSKPNSNRNSNAPKWGFEGHPARATNHDSPVTGHNSQSTDHYSPIAPFASRTVSPGTNHTPFPAMSHCYNHPANASSHSSLTTSHCLFTARVPQFTNHHSPIANQANHTPFPPMSQCYIAANHPKINRKPRRLETVVSHRKQTPETPINRQLSATSISPIFTPDFSRSTSARCNIVPMLELDSALDFFAEFDADFFAALPARPGIFLLEMHESGAQPYLARTADIRRAAERLLSRPETLSKALNLREVTRRIRYRVTGSKFEQSFAYYENARAYFPRRYRDLMRLRPPAMLKVNLRNPYPRCYVTRRIRGDESFYFGPFASRRLAEDFSEGFLDLFKTRRCQIKIRRDPDYPGCMYSEMKMCLAPCFAGCTKEEYDVEVGRVLETLETSGAALTEELAREREAASSALDFERAAALHKRLDKVSAALRGMPDIARRIEELDVVILQRAVEHQTIAVFPVRGGLLDEPLFLRFAEISSEPRSVEAILKDKLEAEPALEEDPAKAETQTRAETEEQQSSAPPETAPTEISPPDTAKGWRSRYGLRSAPPELPEHLSLLARWFYSKPREGEILFRDKVWPYRRMLRACSRLLTGPQPAKIPPHPAQ